MSNPVSKQTRQPARPILPGQAIGILGGGQLGRMFAIAARRMGYRVHALDPTNDCPTGQVADVEINAPYDDLDAARRFAEAVDVVTFEFENVPAETLATIEAIRPVHPSPHVLDTCRHRLHEKTFLSTNGFPVTSFEKVTTIAELQTAAGKLGPRAILKSAEYGYDGKGQVQLAADSDYAAAWKAMGRPIGVVEAYVDFAQEISVIVARHVDGRMQSFEPFANEHHRHILDVTVCPAGLPPDVVHKATEIAEAIADALNVVGVLAVEMFLHNDGRLLVNELAPRPHNSGHLTIDACATSQFEQQLRAVCGLPLGDPTLFRPAAMANLLGDLWTDGKTHRIPDWSAALAHPSVQLHLYGKHAPQPSRKMGHLTATADTTTEARCLVRAARAALTGI